MTIKPQVIEADMGSAYLSPLYNVGILGVGFRAHKFRQPIYLLQGPKGNYVALVTFDDQQAANEWFVDNPDWHNILWQYIPKQSPV